MNWLWKMLSKNKNMFFYVETIHEKGKRANNEDFLLADADKKIFIVCDGVGGHAKGEEASQLATKSFHNFLSDKTINEITLVDALKYTEQKFTDFTAQNSDSEGMATTLTLLSLKDDKSAILAHCGDSRIYHIRNRTILYQTKDHSFVQELLDGGFITEEQAENHPQKNKITRAIKGTEKPTQLSLYQIENIQSEDYFMLCSDGILESISADFISENFGAKTDLKALKNEILQKCHQNTKDNFTAILIKVK